MAQGWRLFGLVRAVNDWEERSHPSDENVVALYEWCFGCMESGPPGDTEGAIRSASDPDELYTVLVPRARALVTYLVVMQDQSIIIKTIVSA